MLSRTRTIVYQQKCIKTFQKPTNNEKVVVYNIEIIVYFSNWSQPSSNKYVWNLDCMH